MFVNSINSYMIFDKLLMHGFIVYLIDYKEGFSSLKMDSFLFHKYNNRSMIFIFIYVYDILITDNDQKDITTLLSFLNQEFSNRALGNALFFSLYWTSPTWWWRLSSFSKQIIIRLLQRVKMEGSRPTFTPIVVNNFSATSSSPTMSDLQIYRSIVRALQYVIITWPNITFIVNLFVNLCMLPLNKIGTVWREFFVISKVLFYMDFFYIVNHLETYILTTMLI